MADQIIMPRALDGNGNPVPGALAEVDDSGTTTPVTVYSDEALTTPLPRPIVSDGVGAWPQQVFTNEGPIKLTIRDAGGAVLPGYPLDPAYVLPASGSSAANVSFSPIPTNDATDVQEAIANVSSGDWTANLDVTKNTPQLNLDNQGTDTEQGVVLASNGVEQARLRRNPATDRVELTAFDDAGANGRTVVIPNGTEAYDVVSGALLTVGDAQANFRPLGNSQTVQDVSGDRATSVSYQNPTGRTIFVWVRCSTLGAFSLQVSPDNINWEVISQGGNQEILTHVGPIPPGYYYQFNGPIGFWKELRT